MRNLKSLSDAALTDDLKSLVKEERRITLEILWHLHEVERRRLFAERGYPSLFEYCLKELGYSESAAFRRISTMRALKETPELEAAIESGRLSVTTVARVQAFFRSEKIQNQKSYDSREKRDLFESLEGKSSKDVEKALCTISPESALLRERERVVSGSLTEIRFLADEALMQKLREAKDLASHRLKDPNSYAELFHLLASQMIEKIRPSETRKTHASPQSRPEETVAAAEVKVSPDMKTQLAKGERAGSPRSHSRYIPRNVRREVWKKSDHRCTYVDPQSRRRCGSTFRLQIDHQWPLALGGSSTDPENLAILCASHNQLRAVQVFGEKSTGRPEYKHGRTGPSRIRSFADVSSREPERPRP